MRQALNEIFAENALGLPEDDLLEHPNTWLTYGYANGDKWTIVTVDVYRGGSVSLSRYDDQDDADPAYEYWLEAMNRDECLRAWSQLTTGDEGSLRAAFQGDRE